MNFNQLKEICLKYGINPSINGIFYLDIPIAKKYFKRRPKYPIFKYEQIVATGELVNKEYNLTWKNRVKSEIIYFKPMDINNLKDYMIEELITKGNLTSTIFGKPWYCEKVAIHTIEEFEQCVKDILDKMYLCNKILNEKGIKYYIDTYQEELRKFKECTRNIENLKKKFKDAFTKQGKLESDF